MGKASYVLMSLALCTGLVVAPQRHTTAHAQTAPLPTCNGTLNSSPMPGRYTGPWRSDAEYHFAVFNTDLDLTVTIAGTLDVTVTSDGRVSGVARGTVDAPIHHDGVHDVSSGTGTISGILQGIVTPTSSTLLLMQPVIAMQWGTFIPDGYTVPRSITMPNYQFSLNRADCISLGGGIAEHNFPTQFVVNDGASGLTQAPGIGDATGAWSLSHVQSDLFSQLSRGVDDFISNANAALAPSSGSPSMAVFTASVLGPLKTLLASIHQNPDISGCLLQRLNAWVAATVPAMRVQAQGLKSTPGLTMLRQASDLAKFSGLLQVECLVSEDGTLSAVSSHELSALDDAMTARDWSTVALLIRENILTTADPAESAHRSTNDLHTLAQAPLGPVDRLDVARVAYAVGDDADARLSAAAGAHVGTFTARVVLSPTKRHKKRKATPKPTATKTATPTPRPTVTPTATPKPVSLAATLQSGVSSMNVRATGSAMPSFSWQPVSGATKYVVFVAGSNPNSLTWAWSGSETSVSYGDTALAGLPGSETDGWPQPNVPADYTWSVLALDGSGHILGLSLRASAS